MIGVLYGASMLPTVAQSMIDSSTITVESGSVYDASGTFAPENLLDGELAEGNQDSHLGTHWLASEGTFTETVTFDLGGRYDLTHLSILNTSNSGWQDFTEDFQDVPLAAPGVTHVRLEVTNEDADDQDSNDVRVGLNEVRFFHHPGADSDNDGMVDEWEVAHFGDLSRDGTEDEDDPAPDGLTNKEEHDESTDPKDADSDDDGLTDGDETHTHRTNPNEADSDGDTLSDQIEVVTLMTNPNAADSDDDGLGDADEVNVHHTDPNDADTDDDLLTDGDEVNVFSTNPLLPDMIVDPATITVTAGSTYANADEELFNVTNLIDGLTDEGDRDTHRGTHWIALEGTFTETVTFDLGDFYALTAVQILNTSNTGWNDSETDTFTVATSTDGGASFSDPSDEIALQDFSDGFQGVPIDESGISHVQLVITNEDADDQGTNDVRVGLRTRIDSGIVQPDSGVQVVSIPVRNTGSDTLLEISSVVLSQTGSVYSLVSFPDSIAPRENGMIEVTLDPTQVQGLYSAELVITSNDPSEPTFTSMLSVSVPLSPALSAWYPMDETTGSLRDASGNGRHASAVGNVTLGQEGLGGGNSVQLTPAQDGSISAYVEVQGFPVLHTLSVSMWAQANGEFPTGIGTLFSKVEGEENSPFSLAVFSSLGDTLGWIVSESPEDFGVRVASTTLVEPTHVVVVHEDANGGGEGATFTRIYLNGQLAAEVQDSPGFADVVDRLQIGARAGANGFAGLIDDVQVYNRALSDDEVTALFQNPGTPIGAEVVPPVTTDDRLPALENVGIGASGAMSVTIPSGVTADIEYSTDLIDWEVISTGQEGTVEETDAIRIAAPTSFYRAKQ